MSRNLIIYYSRRGQNYVGGSIVNLARGNTELVVGYIADAVGADLFEVVTAKPYSEDYTACTEEAKAELRSHARPELRNYLSDISGYDRIAVAGPCWWGTYPCGVFTQLEKLDFTGKRVFPLMTHEGSGLGRAVRDLRDCCRGADIGAGLAVRGSEALDARETVSAWARQHLA